MGRRLTGPLVANMTAQGIDRTQLRAQVAVSALVGITLGRSLGWFDAIRSVPRDELVALIVDALGTITEDGPGASSETMRSCPSQCPHQRTGPSRRAVRPHPARRAVLCPAPRRGGRVRGRTPWAPTTHGLGVFIVEHDVALIQWICDRIYVPNCCERRPTLLKIQSGRIGC